MRTNCLIKLSLLFFVMLLGFIGNSYGQYCAPQYNYPCEQSTGSPTADYINNFSTSNGITNIVNNNTACNGQPNNFIYYSNMTVTATQGCSFNVSMQCGSTYQQGFGIWVDWNQDLDYSDAGEYAYNSGASGFQVFNGTIQVPATALVGTTR
ncbi:MAG TPA: GEVED domain-containing protein, partial [Flavobacteriales bacterium]|nr:GEVED domain-containing protein [Flavobacteriales bacterium]